MSKPRIARARALVLAGLATLGVGCASAPSEGAVSVGSAESDTDLENHLVDMVLQIHKKIKFYRPEDRPEFGPQSNANWVSNLYSVYDVKPNQWWYCRFQTSSSGPPEEVPALKKYQFSAVQKSTAPGGPFYAISLTEVVPKGFGAPADFDLVCGPPPARGRRCPDRSHPRK